MERGAREAFGSGDVSVSKSRRRAWSEAEPRGGERLTCNHEGGCLSAMSWEKPHHGSRDPGRAMRVVAVAKGRTSALPRLLIAVFAFMCAWLLAAELGALGAPGWTMFMGGAVIVVSIAVMLGAVHVWSQVGEGGESEGEHRGDDGEGGPRPDAPEPGGGGNDPRWWPEFERQLAFYTAEREERKQHAAMLPARAGALCGESPEPIQRPER
jgi:hypothetical protein